MRKMVLMVLPLLCGCEGEAERAVRQQMLDPDAAQFRGVQQCSGDREVWRGEANGKNSFGAYTGFKSFYYSGGQLAYLGDAGSTALMERCYSDLKSTAAASSAPATVPSTSASVPIKKPKPVEVVVKSTAKQMDFDAEEEGPGRPNLAATDLCWADYCPCDTSDPDYGYLDVPLCRNLRMGVEVSDKELSLGAQSRDARKSLREFKEDNP